MVARMCSTTWAAAAQQFGSPSLLALSNRVQPEGTRWRVFGYECPLWLKPAKSLVPHAPGGLGAPVLATRRIPRLDLPRRGTTPAIVFAVCAGVFRGKIMQVASRLRPIQNTKAQERAVYHREAIATVARRLPHRTRREVVEIIELLIEVWSKELVRG